MSHGNNSNIFTYPETFFFFHTHMRSSKKSITPYMCLATWLCLTLCSPLDYSPPGSSVHRIFQGRILESVAISFSRRSSRSRDKPRSPVSPPLQADSLPTKPLGKPSTPCIHLNKCEEYMYKISSFFSVIFTF